MKTPINPNAYNRRSAYIDAMERHKIEPQLIQVEGDGWNFEEIGVTICIIYYNTIILPRVNFFDGAYCYRLAQMHHPIVGRKRMYFKKALGAASTLALIAGMAHARDSPTIAIVNNGHMITMQKVAEAYTAETGVELNHYRLAPVGFLM